MESPAQKALNKWVRGAKIEVLQCRTSQHALPYLDEWNYTKPTELKGLILAEGYCTNGCGTHVRRIYSSAGYLVSSSSSRSNRSHAYDDEYKLPQVILEALAAGHLTRADIRAACRKELMFIRSGR